mgnify:CR=1 FL=1
MPKVFVAPSFSILFLAHWFLTGGARRNSVFLYKYGLTPVLVKKALKSAGIKEIVFCRMPRVCYLANGSSLKVGASNNGRLKIVEEILKSVRHKLLQLPKSESRLSRAIYTYLIGEHVKENFFFQVVALNFVRNNFRDEEACVNFYMSDFGLANNYVKNNFPFINFSVHKPFFLDSMFWVIYEFGFYLCRKVDQLKKVSNKIDIPICSVDHRDKYALEPNLNSGVAVVRNFSGENKADLGRFWINGSPVNSAIQISLVSQYDFFKKDKKNELRVIEICLAFLRSIFSFSYLGHASNLSVATSIGGFVGIYCRFFQMEVLKNYWLTIFQDNSIDVLLDCSYGSVSLGRALAMKSLGGQVICYQRSRYYDNYDWSSQRYADFYLVESELDKKMLDLGGFELGRVITGVSLRFISDDAIQMMAGRLDCLLDSRSFRVAVIDEPGTIYGRKYVTEFFKAIIRYGESVDGIQFIFKPKRVELLKEIVGPEAFARFRDLVSVGKFVVLRSDTSLEGLSCAVDILVTVPSTAMFPFLESRKKVLLYNPLDTISRWVSLANLQYSNLHSFSCLALLLDELSNSRYLRDQRVCEVEYADCGSVASEVLELFNVESE